MSWVLIGYLPALCSGSYCSLFINNYLALQCFETKNAKTEEKCLHNNLLSSCWSRSNWCPSVICPGRPFEVIQNHSLSLKTAQRHTRLTSPKDTPHPQAMPSTMNIVRLLPAVSMQRISTWLRGEYERCKKGKILPERYKGIKQ